MDDDTRLEASFDIHNFQILPKLKNEYNFQLWNLSFRNALTAESNVYIKILDGTLKIPKPPKLHDTTDEAVERDIILGRMDEDEAEGYDHYKQGYEITNREMRERIDELDNSNNVLLQNHGKILDNWHCMQARLYRSLFACIEDNPRGFIISIKDPVEAYNILVKKYGKASQQSGLRLWKKFVKMHYKGSDAASFPASTLELRRGHCQDTTPHRLRTIYEGDRPQSSLQVFHTYFYSRRRSSDRSFYRKEV